MLLRKKLFPKLIFLGYFGSILLLNTFTYKWLVKLVWLKLNLIGFWPIHFAIFPFMTIINFSLFGISEGIFGYIYFEKFIKDSSWKIIYG